MLYRLLASVVLLTYLAAGEDDKMLKVVTIHDPPYVWVNASDPATSFKGFVADLLTHVTKKLGYTYNVTHVKNQFGAKDSQGHWTGVIQLLDQRMVDLGAAALSKNVERTTVVDFSTAFLHTKLQLLTHKSRKHLHNITDLALERNNSVPYGAIREGNTWTLLTKATTDEALKTVGAGLTAVNTTAEGVELVRQDKFVMIMEGLTADYWVSKYPCDLDTSEGHLFEVEYAFAVRRYHEGKFIEKLNEELNKDETKKKIASLRVQYWAPTHCEDGKIVAGAGASTLSLAAVAHAVSWLVALLICIL